MAYTPEQIKTYADNYMGQGGNAQDLWQTAQSNGVDLGQLSGAFGLDAAGGAKWFSDRGVNTGYTAPAPAAAPAATLPATAPSGVASLPAANTLGKGVLDYFASNPTGMYTDQSTGRTYRSDANAGWGQDQTGASALSKIYEIDPTTNKGKPGDPYKVFNGDGSYDSMGKNNDQSDAMWQLAFAAAMAGGIGFDAGMFGGGGGAGVGAGAGGGANGTILSKAALDGTTAFGANSVGGAYSLGGAGGAFNAAMDSQAANAAIEAAGGDALSGYTAAGTGGVTGMPAGIETVANTPQEIFRQSEIAAQNAGQGAVPPGTSLPSTPSAPTPSTSKGITDLLQKAISDPTKLATLLAGAAALKGAGGGGGGGGYAGYEGGIPSLDASRTQYGNDNTRRPGSAPQRYFSDTRYSPAGTGTGLTQAGSQTSANNKPAPITASTPPGQRAPVSASDIKSFVDNQLNTPNISDAQRAAAIKQAATANNVSLEQIAAATGYPLEKIKAYLGMARGGVVGYAGGGGIAGLGGYSDGGRLLRGPGDGTSDDIPATIGGNQPARLADGEFVLPARIVSEIGNGSTDAGSRKLYQMMDRIQSGRRKLKDVGADAKADKHLPA